MRSLSLSVLIVCFIQRSHANHLYSDGLCVCSCFQHYGSAPLLYYSRIWFLQSHSPSVYTLITLALLTLQTICPFNNFVQRRHCLQQWIYLSKVWWGHAKHLYSDVLCMLSGFQHYGSIPSLDHVKVLIWGILPYTSWYILFCILFLPIFVLHLSMRFLQPTKWNNQDILNKFSIIF